MFLQIILREVRLIFLNEDVYCNFDLSNRLKNSKRLHFVRPNNKLKIPRNSVNIVDAKENNLRNSEDKRKHVSPNIH